MSEATSERSLVMRVGVKLILLSLRSSRPPLLASFLLAQSHLGGHVTLSDDASNVSARVDDGDHVETLILEESDGSADG